MTKEKRKKAGIRGNVVNLDSKIIMYLGTVFGREKTKVEPPP
jgi:hypothetical protein